MAEFEVKVVRIDSVTEHPNADRLTLVKIGGYTCIANKHEDGSWRYQAGDLVVYIPENAVVPEWLLRKQDMWNEEKGIGFLAGSKGNRVKAIKLRGIFSEGILYAVKPQDEPSMGIYVMDFVRDGVEMETGVREGDDVGEKLGITKYEPEIPASMSGEVFNLGRAPIKFDLEPIEKHLDLILPNEVVDFTEKLHGTCTGVSIIRGLNHPETFVAPWGSRDVVVWSKGLGSKGLVFKDNAANASNLYVQTYTAYFGANDKFWDTIIGRFMDEDYDELHFVGETYGPGVQDLSYGASKKEFRLFAIAVVKNREVLWLNQTAITFYAAAVGIPRVPILYTGPFNMEVMEEIRDGKTSLGGDHIREGIVITPQLTRVDETFGVVRLKAVSPAYKLRKGGSEFN